MKLTPEFIILYMQSYTFSYSIFEYAATFIILLKIYVEAVKRRVANAPELLLECVIF
jgi:hypothetical protein